MRLHGIVANDHAIQRICAEMHIVGMELDPEERKRLEREYRYIAKKHYRKLMNYAESVRKVCARRARSRSVSTRSIRARAIRWRGCSSTTGT